MFVTHRKIQIVLFISKPPEPKYAAICAYSKSGISPEFFCHEFFFFFCVRQMTSHRGLGSVVEAESAICCCTGDRSSTSYKVLKWGKNYPTEAIKSNFLTRNVLKESHEHLLMFGTHRALCSASNKPYQPQYCSKTLLPVIKMHLTRCPGIFSLFFLFCWTIRKVENICKFAPSGQRCAY